MSLAVIAVTPSGLKTALRVRGLYPHATLFCYERLKGEPEAVEAEQIHFFQENLPCFTGTVFHSFKALVFVTAAGIAVRSIAPYLEDKKSDPAVVVVDDTGFFAVSLLSGHRGGANDLAAEIAAYLGGVAVITTSTDRHNIVAFDLLARRRGWVIEHEQDLKKISAAQVAGRNLLLYAEQNIAVELPGKYVLARSEREFYQLLGLPEEENGLRGLNLAGYSAEKPGPFRKWEGAVLISSGLSLPAVPAGLPFIVLRPRRIAAGIGCRKGVPVENIIKALQDAFERCGRKIESLKGLATISDKEKEAGLVEAAGFFRVPLHFFTKEQIQEVEHLFSASFFVREQVGVASVAEPCAYLGSACGELILRKTTYPGITVALAETPLQLQ